MLGDSIMQQRAHIVEVVMMWHDLARRIFKLGQVCFSDICMSNRIAINRCLKCRPSHHIIKRWLDDVVSEVATVQPRYCETSGGAGWSTKPARGPSGRHTASKVAH